MRDRRAAQAEALAVLRAGLRADAVAYPEALDARLSGELDAFVEATAAGVLATLATLATTDTEEDN